MLEHEAEEKAYKYEKKYSEDFKLKDMLSRPEDFEIDGIQRVVDLLKRKAYRDGYKEGAVRGHNKGFDSGKSFASLVDVDLNAFRTREKSRSVRRNITLPQWLDDMATVAMLNVSAIAQSALKKELGLA